MLESLESLARLDHLIRREERRLRSAAGRRWRCFAADRQPNLEVGHSMHLAPECSPLRDSDLASDCRTNLVIDRRDLATAVVTGRHLVCVD